MANEENLIQIHQHFATTQFGQILAQQIRYEKYKPDNVSAKNWVTMLGADVNNLSHLLLTHGLTASFIRTMHETGQGDLLTEREAKVLKVAALIHDWAESIVGDISYGDKTEANEVEEAAQFSSNLDRFYPRQGHFRPLIDEAFENVIFKPDNKLGKCFNAIERAGHLRTALRAHDYIQQVDDPLLSTRLKWLVGDVLSNQTLPLIDYTDGFQPIDRLLKKQERKISQAFQAVDLSTFNQYMPADVHKKKDQFITAQIQWDNFVVNKIGISK